MGDTATAEVDHVFVSASRGAPEARKLIELGLLEGSPNRHPGQGTANRRFFFANAMLELSWVRIFAPGAATASESLLAALRTGAFSFQRAAQPLLELGFDGERGGGRADLRPVLPLVLLW